MPRFAEFSYGYRDIARLSGMDLNAIQQHVRRENLNPADLGSLLVWIARHGKIGLRMRLVHAALGEPAKRSTPRRAGRKPKRRTKATK